MSLRAPDQQYSVATSGVFSNELANPVDKDIIVVSAYGNSFNGYSSVQGVDYPSADPYSLSIGATYDANIGNPSPYGDGSDANSTAADRITPFSQRHHAIDDGYGSRRGNHGGIVSGRVCDRKRYQPTAHVTGIAVLAQQLALRDLGRRLTQAEFADCWTRPTSTTVTTRMTTSRTRI